MSLRDQHNAALAADKSAVVAHYGAEEAKAAEEAQMRRDAQLWRKLISMHIFDITDMADECMSIDDFIETIEAQ